MLTFSSINLKEEIIYFTSQRCDSRNVRKMKFFNTFHKYVTFTEVNISNLAFQTVEMEKNQVSYIQLYSMNDLLVRFTRSLSPLLVYAFDNILFYFLQTEYGVILKINYLQKDEYIYHNIK